MRELEGTKKAAAIFQLIYDVTDLLTHIAAMRQQLCLYLLYLPQDPPLAPLTPGPHMSVQFCDEGSWVLPNTLITKSGATRTVKVSVHPMGIQLALECFNQP